MSDWKKFVASLPLWSPDSDYDDDNDNDVDEKKPTDSVRPEAPAETVDGQRSSVVERKEDVVVRKHKRKRDEKESSRKRTSDQDVVGARALADALERRPDEASVMRSIISRQDRVRRNREIVYDLDEKTLVERLRAYKALLRAGVSQETYAKRFSMAAVVRALRERFEWVYQQFYNENVKQNQVLLLQKLGVDGVLDLDAGKLSLEEAIASGIVACPSFFLVRNASLSNVWGNGVQLLLKKLELQQKTSITPPSSTRGSMTPQPSSSSTSEKKCTPRLEVADRFENLRTLKFICALLLKDVVLNSSIEQILEKCVDVHEYRNIYFVLSQDRTDGSRTAMLKKCCKRGAQCQECAKW